MFAERKSALISGISGRILFYYYFIHILMLFPADIADVRRKEISVNQRNQRENFILLLFYPYINVISRRFRRCSQKEIRGIILFYYYFIHIFILFPADIADVRRKEISVNQRNQRDNFILLLFYPYIYIISRRYCRCTQKGNQR